MGKGFRCKREDCIYRATAEGANETLAHPHACNYFFLTGVTRRSQLPPDMRDPAICPLYIPRANGQKPMLQNRRPQSPPWEPMALQMHKEGKNDTEIAKAVGVKPYNIANWRHKRGLAAVPNARCNERRRTFDTEKAFALYRAGKLDREIAEALHVSRQTISNWRLENDLKSNDVTNRPRERKSIYDWDKAMVLYEAGETDGTIAKILGGRPQAVQKWRKRNNLPSKHKIQKEEKSE